MQAAQKRDAIKHQKFHFRKNLSTSMKFNKRNCSSIFYFHLAQTPVTPSMASVPKPTFQENECEHRLMTIDEIINGSVRYS